jgi:ubiquinone/menaquinone biosynthesis C-methylase UbiE
VIHCLSGRVLKPEILDTLPYDQARASLADLVRLNRQWGGHSTLRRILGKVVKTGEAFTLLDVGAASGDMGACVHRWYPRARVTSIDLNFSHLARCEGARVCGDAFRLPFRPGAFDFVFCSLFLHHFTNDQVVELLADFGQIARRAVLVIDLERNPVPYYFVPWTRWIFGWDPVTVNDAQISVEAAFRPRELEELAERAELKDVRAQVYRPAFRIAMIARLSSSPGL